MFYRGFDTYQWPGDAQMSALKGAFDWCGYYLPAPSHPNLDWVGRRPHLVAAGWGLAPIFVGQQIVGPGSHVVTADQGKADGMAAAETMARDEFPPGSWLYIDLENGPPYGKPEGDYVSAVIAAVTAGGYRAGVYCSHAMAAAVAAAHPEARIWAFRVPTVERTFAAPPYAAPDPAMCGYAGAFAWQYRQNVRLSVGGLFDLSSSRTADPSSPTQP